MEIIVNKGILEMYLSSLGPGTKTHSIGLLIRILENNENKIVLSKRIVDKIEEELSTNPGLIDFFHSFIKDIYDSNRFDSIQTTQDNEVDELLEIFNQKKGNGCQFGLLDSDNNSFDKHPELKTRCCFFSNLNKPNKCWLIFNILALRSVSVRYNDFKNNKEIEGYFESFFNLPPQISEIYILDSYCNIRNHNLFASILNKGYEIHVFTSAANRKPFETKVIKDDLKDFFGKTRTHVKFSTNKSLIHERTISINDFTLESNHDFAELKRNNSNWKLDITVDSTLRSEIIQKCKQFN